MKQKHRPRPTASWEMARPETMLAAARALEATARDERIPYPERVANAARARQIRALIEVRG